MELGLASFLTGVIGLMVQSPVPAIMPEDVEAMEGRTVRVSGFVDDVQVGTDSHRGVLTADGHAVRFEADGTNAPREGSWVDLRGTLYRHDGWLVLRVESSPWTW